MKEQFCSYEISMLLKEKGFDESCFAYYRNRNEDDLIMLSTGIAGTKYSWLVEKEVILAPLYQSAIMWLMKKLDFDHPNIQFRLYKDGSGAFNHYENSIDIDFNNLEEGILKALKLI